MKIHFKKRKQVAIIIQPTKYVLLLWIVNTLTGFFSPDHKYTYKSEPISKVRKVGQQFLSYFVTALFHVADCRRFFHSSSSMKTCIIILTLWVGFHCTYRYLAYLINLQINLLLKRLLFFYCKHTYCSCNYMPLVSYFILPCLYVVQFSFGMLMVGSGLVSKS